MSGRHYFAVAFIGIATLGAVAYYLERKNRAELDSAVTDAFKVGGWLTGFFQKPAPTAAQGKYLNPTAEV